MSKLLAKLLLILISIPTFSHAYIFKTNIKCPSIKVIQEAANSLYEANSINSSYIANTLPWAIHTGRIGWFAVVYDIKATSAKEALGLAKQVMQAASAQDAVGAQNLGGIYRCSYDKRKIEVISNDNQLY